MNDNNRFSTYEMELQISCGVCSEISKESILWREMSREKRDIKDTMPMEGSRNNRRRSMTRPHTSAFKYTPENECIRIYGVFERKEQSVNISEVWEHEICIPKPGILV